MLLPLILTTWLAAFALALALCRMAARGDAPLAPAANNARHSSDGSLVHGDISTGVALHKGPPAASAHLAAQAPRRQRA
jgi:hypothetical protein